MMMQPVLKELQWKVSLFIYFRSLDSLSRDIFTSTNLP